MIHTVRCRSDWLVVPRLMAMARMRDSPRRHGRLLGYPVDDHQICPAFTVDFILATSTQVSGLVSERGGKLHGAPPASATQTERESFTSSAANRAALAYRSRPSWHTTISAANNGFKMLSRQDRSRAAGLNELSLSDSRLSTRVVGVFGQADLLGKP
jgi:hypothetical protein